MSGIGLLLAPFLIAAYGFAGYGQILIARTFIPGNVVGLFDLGVSENATRCVAAARADSRWQEAGESLTLLLALSILVGILLGGVLFLAADGLASWFSVPTDQQAGFVQVLWLTSFAMPLLMLSLVAEGIVKGFERFEIVRSIEVVAALSYAGMTFAVVVQGLGPNWVAAVLLASLVIRFGCAAVAAMRLLAPHHVGLRKWSPEVRSDISRWSLTMFSSKIIGTFQNQVSSPLVGLIFGPAAVGLYDAVVRLPRFARSILGLVSGTVLPLASRLHSKQEEHATGRLAYYGILGSIVITWPPVIAAAAFSKPILSAWIGPTVEDYWFWQSLMFGVTLLAVPISFGSSMALADRTASRHLIRLTAIQVFIQFSISFLLIDRFGPWAFIIGQVIAVGSTFPFQYQVFRKALHLKRLLLGRMAAVAGISLAVSGAVAWAHQPDNVWELAAISALAILASLLLGVMAALTREEFGLIVQMVRRNAHS